MKNKIQTVNIGLSNANDPFYRYKMPVLLTYTQGKGNGIKTMINITEIAPYLDRDPEEILKYMSYTIGASSKIDKDNNAYSINGEHDNATLILILDDYITKFLQCYKCGNPETFYEFKGKKNMTLRLRCKACRHTSKVDPCEKLVTFIVKNLQQHLNQQPQPESYT